MPRGRKPKPLITWKEKALAKAKERTAIRPVAGDSTLISIKGGVFTFGGAPLPEELNVIVLDELVENSRYAEKYIEGEFQTPICYALGEPLSTCSSESDLLSGMRPHEKAPEPQSTDCANCRWNQFGSADDGGRGKGCGNRRRLMVMAADRLDDLENAMVATLRVPPTGLKIWDAYANWLYRIEELTPEYVVTRLSLKKIRPTDMAALPHFEYVATLPDDICEKVETFIERNRYLLVQPFPDNPEQEEMPKPTRKKRVAKKKAVKR